LLRQRIDEREDRFARDVELRPAFHLLEHRAGAVKDDVDLGAGCVATAVFSVPGPSRFGS
jgi:hypothetical protein